MLPPYIDLERPHCSEMLEPALVRAEQLPVVWDLRAGQIALVVLNTPWPSDDELRLAIAVHKTLARGVLAIV